LNEGSHAAAAIASPTRIIPERIEAMCEDRRSENGRRQAIAAVHCSRDICGQCTARGTARNACPRAAICQPSPARALARSPGQTAPRAPATGRGTSR
jgi:hypothetical protein